MAEPVGDSHPTLRRRELAAALRRYREAAGLTTKQVTQALRISASKLSRIETGARPVSDRDLQRLAALYEIDTREQEHLLDVAEESKQSGWWEKYDLPYADYVGLESTAVGIDDYKTSTIPSLVQTPGYAHSLARANAPHMSPSLVEQIVEVKIIRQRILNSPDGPSVTLVIDEAALRRPIGGPLVMLDQIGHIESLVSNEGLSFHVIPFTAGWHPGMDRAFTILSFDVAIRDVVYIESPISDSYVDNPKDLERYRENFSDLVDLALTTDESADFIRGLMGV